MLPIANEIKTRKAAYFADAKDGSGTAFSKLNLDITIGSGVWGGARSVEKSGKFGVSIREKLAHRLADQPSGFKSGALTEAYGTVRNLPRWGAFGTVGYYAGMFGAGLLPMPARTISRMAGIGGIAALGGIREGGITWSNNGRLMGLGGKTTEKVAQTSYELARGRKSSPDAALMQQMEGLMVHREKAEGLTTAITALSGKTELTADEAKTLLTAVAHAKARIGLTDQSVTRPDSKARRVFDLATPNNFIEFSEGGENRQYMALRKAIIDGQIALARGKHADHLDEAVLVMQGQLAKGNDQEGIKEWLVTQGKTEAEAAQMVTTQFVDKGITPDQGMNKRIPVF
jgi:hypothetical protein